MVINRDFGLIPFVRSHLSFLVDQNPECRPGLKRTHFHSIQKPLAFVHRYAFWGKSSTSQNLFFASTGIGLIYGCYGKDVMHSIICTLAQWATFQILGSSKRQVYISFLFQFTYLLGKRLDNQCSIF